MLDFVDATAFLAGFKPMIDMALKCACNEWGRAMWRNIERRGRRSCHLFRPIPDVVVKGGTLS